MIDFWQVFVCVWAGGTLYGLCGALMVLLSGERQGAGRSVVMSALWIPVVISEVSSAVFDYLDQNDEDDRGTPIPIPVERDEEDISP